MAIEKSDNLPFNLECEQDILGGLLFDPKKFEFYNLASIIDVESFYIPSHQQLYKAIVEAIAEKGDEDSFLVFIAASEKYLALHKAEKFSETPINLTSLTARIVSATNIDRYAAVVAEKKELRDNIEIANLISQSAQEPLKKAQEIRQLREEKFAAIKEANIVDHGQDAAGRLLEMGDESAEGLLPCLSTGLSSLDKLLGGGLRPTELIILAGRPGMGKTLFATYLARVISAKTRVIFYSAEMATDNIVARLASAIADVPYQKIETRDVKGVEDQIAEAAVYLSERDIAIYDDISKISDLDWLENIVKNSIGCQLIILDYIQFIVPQSQDPVGAIAEYTKRFKAIAKKYNVAVLLLAQLNRGVEGRNDKRPMMSDLKSSGSLEQDADKVLFLYRDEYYNGDDSDSRGLTEVIVAKNRSGVTGSTNIKSSMGLGKYFDVPSSF